MTSCAARKHRASYSGLPRQPLDLCAAKRASDVVDASAKEDARIEPGDAVPAAERERAIDLAAIEFEYPEDAFLPAAGDAPEVRPADQLGARPKRPRALMARVGQN